MMQVWAEHPQCESRRVYGFVPVLCPFGAQGARLTRNEAQPAVLRKLLVYIVICRIHSCRKELR